MKRFLLAALSCMTLAAPVHATTHTYEFTATVTEMYLADVVADVFLQPDTMSGIAAGSAISVGDKVVGHFSYDTSATLYYNAWFYPDGWDVTKPGSFMYVAGPTAPMSLDFTIVPSGQKFSAHPDFLYVGYNDKADGSFSFYTNDGIKHGNLGVAQALTSGALPEHLSLMDGAFNRVNEGWTLDNGNMYGVSATINTMTEVSAVPEPESYAMLLAGLALLGMTAGVARRTSGPRA